MSEASSSHFFAPVFKANANKPIINALSDAAQGLFLMLHTLSFKIENILCIEIANIISPELMINRSTTPFILLWTKIKNY